MNRHRFVLDTSTLVGAALFEGSIPDHAVRRAFALGDVLLSAETLSEAADVLRRPKFDNYVSLAVREEFLVSYVERSKWVEVTETIKVCRDPKDDMFLALAVSGKAQAIVSGDQDLLVLDPFRGASILTPAAFLATYKEVL